jgi:serine/threonine-protein kinase
MAELLPGDVIAGKFRLERVIGRGGMGAVWAARHAQLGMPVALKFIEVEEGGDAADARVRFEREAMAAAQIRSPHVAQIIDHGIDRDQPYIVMELLEGEDLGERLRREGRISVNAAARILTQAAKALRRAYEAGIIHRELKPGNVFLARFDDDEIVKILDFGVAKVRRTGAIEQATATGIVFGSPSYMSPEQARGVRDIDHRSDLWSLAVITFRAITGVKPFQAESIGELVVKLCIDPLPVATAHAAHLPVEVDGFFERAFARDPDRRFATAVEMAAAFEIAIGNAPAPRSMVAPPMQASPEPPSSRTPPPTSGPSPIGGFRAPPAAFVPRPSAPSIHPAHLGAFALPSPPTLPATPPPALPAPATHPPAAPGSGPHLAFAPGTLTPPAGAPLAAPSEASRPPPGDPRPAFPSAVSFGAPAAPPIVPGASPPWPHGAVDFGPPPPPPPRAAPRPQSFAPSLQRATTPSGMVIGAGLGAVVLMLLVAVIIVAARGGGPSSAAVAAAAPPQATAVPAPPAAPLPAEAAIATASAASTASAAPPAPSVPTPASAEASAVPAPEPSASAAADPSATPPLPPRKRGKKRPNFGY